MTQLDDVKTLLTLQDAAVAVAQARQAEAQVRHGSSARFRRNLFAACGLSWHALVPLFEGVPAGCRHARRLRSGARAITQL